MPRKEPLPRLVASRLDGLIEEVEEARNAAMKSYNALLANLESLAKYIDEAENGVRDRPLGAPPKMQIVGAGVGES